MCLGGGAADRTRTIDKWRYHPLHIPIFRGKIANDLKRKLGSNCEIGSELAPPIGLEPWTSGDITRTTSHFLLENQILAGSIVSDKSFI